MKATDRTRKESSAVSKAVTALKKIIKSGKTLPAMDWSESLNLAARDHCNDLGKQGLYGHFGTDESSPFDRISKYGKPGWWRGENLSFD